MRRALARGATSAGRLLEALGNERPREMAASTLLASGQTDDGSAETEFGLQPPQPDTRPVAIPHGIATVFFYGLINRKYRSARPAPWRPQSAHLRPVHPALRPVAIAAR